MAALERVKRDGNAAANAQAEEALVYLLTSEEIVSLLQATKDDKVMENGLAALVNTAFNPGPVLVNRDNALVALLNNSEAMAQLDRVNALDIEGCKPWLNDCILALRNI